MKPFAKINFTRVCIALLLATLSMFSITAISYADTYKIGDTYGGGKVAYIFLRPVTLVTLKGNNTA